MPKTWVIVLLKCIKMLNDQESDQKSGFHNITL